MAKEDEAKMKEKYAAHILTNRKYETVVELGLEMINAGAGTQQ